MQHHLFHKFYSLNSQLYHIPHTCWFPKIASNKYREISTKLFGNNHPNVAIAHAAMGLLHHAKEDYDSAIDCHRKSIAISENILGIVSASMYEITRIYRLNELIGLLVTECFIGMNERSVRISLTFLFTIIVLTLNICLCKESP